MKRENGFFILDSSLEILEENEKGYPWFFIQGSKQMFKPVSLLWDAYQELFGEEIAKSLKITTVHYDLAQYKEDIGVLTDNFNPSNEECFPLDKVLLKFYRDVIWNHPSLFIEEQLYTKTYNLETIWMALLHFYKNNALRDSIVERIMNQIVDSFILQICLGNPDMHEQNLFLINGKCPCLAPNFDYIQSGYVNLVENSGFYNLQVTPNHEVTKDKPIETIRSFLSLSSSEIQKYFYEKISMMPTCDELFFKVEQRTCYPIPKEVQDHFKMYYEDYQKQILNLFDSMSISFER